MKVVGTVVPHPVLDAVASLHLSPVAMVTPVAAMIQVAVLVVDAQSARLAWSGDALGGDRDARSPCR